MTCLDSRGGPVGRLGPWLSAIVGERDFSQELW
jgi:hypothetical protein